MSKLLIHDNPILILPSLALKIGLNEAIMLQQIHYWLVSSQYERDGRNWIYNTYKQWQQQIPFLSESTIKRTIKSLEKKGYVISGNFNQHKMDKTKWYTIQYEMLEEAMETEEKISQDSPTGQDEMTSDSACPMVEAAVTQAIPESTSENTTESTTEKTTENKNMIPFSEIIAYLNDKTNASYKPVAKRTKDLITERWKEGFLLEDFKRVVDLKIQEWLFDPVWNKYLRPETLFGPKFESYLNQKSGKKHYCEEGFNLDD